MATIHLAVRPIYRKSLLIEFRNKNYELDVMTSNEQFNITYRFSGKQISLIESQFLINQPWIDKIPEPIVILGSLRHIFLLIEIRKKICGFITLEESFGTLSCSIKDALNGYWIMSSNVKDFFQLDTLQQQKKLLKNNLSRPLTKSELEILYEISKGNTNKQIAGQRFRSIHTVKTQRKQIRRKLNLTGQGALVVLTARYTDQIHTLLTIASHSALIGELMQNTPG